jgi:hypothetical protein
MKKVLLLLFCSAMAFAAGDVSGKWTGIIDVDDTSSGEVISTPVAAVFEQKAAVISGKIGRQADEQGEAITNGKIEGTKISFEVTAPEAEGAFKFDLTVVDGDRIEGDMKGKIETGPISGKVHLKRSPR